MTRPLRTALLAAAIPVLLGLGACSDPADPIDSPFGDREDDTVDSDLGSVSGLVVDASGSPVPFVRVVASAGGGAAMADTGFADDNGRFFLAGLPLDRAVVRFSDNPQRVNANYRRLELTAGGELHFPDVVILPVQRGTVFFADEGAESLIGGTLTGAVFADTSFVAPDGTVYLDRVAPYMAVATSDEQHFAAAFPGEFLGEREDGTTVALEAYGVLWTYVASQAGAMRLAPGKAVTYRLEAPADAPATAVVWELDTTTGRWLERGESTLDGGVYEAELATLGPVCWANPAGDVCEVQGTVRDNAGQPLAGANVVYRDATGRYRQSVLTAADGTFAMTVQPAPDATLTPYLGSVVGAPETVDTLADCPLVLGEPLQVTLPDSRIELRWDADHGDLDASYLIFLAEDDDLVLEWELTHVRRGSLGGAPFAEHQGDSRDGGPETILGRRWYDGATQYWVHDYTGGTTESLRASGAVVDLVINEQSWTFPVTDAVFDAEESDSTGWWHVFDIVIDGAQVQVDTVQAFRPQPTP
jgi:hypothetical protein